MEIFKQIPSNIFLKAIKRIRLNDSNEYGIDDTMVISIGEKYEDYFD